MSGPDLAPISEKTNGTPIRPELIAWCPTMDLLAFASDSNEVVLNRLSGQRVWQVVANAYSVSHGDLAALTWRPDGKVLAIGFDNGDIQYLDVNDGKVISNLPHIGEPVSKATYLMRWSESKKVELRSKTELTWDVRTQLPFLSPLPTSNVDRVYTSKHAIHTLIHDLESDSQRPRFLAICTDPYQIEFFVGSFHLDLTSRRSSGHSSTSIKNYNTSSDLSNHVVLSIQETGLHLDVYEFNLSQSGDPVVRILLNTFNDFHALSSYLFESIDVLEEEYALVIETRSPGLEKLQKHLELRQGSVRDDLFTLLMTGMPSAEVDTWLKEDLGERLIKRWEKTTQSGFNNMRGVIVDSCLLSCDRLIILLMSLRTIATNQSTQEVTGLAVIHIDLCIKIVTLLMAQLHSLLRVITKELDLFLSFCAWLVFIIARISPDDETPDAAMPCAFRKVATYIEDEYPLGTVSHFFGAKIVDLEEFLDKDIQTLEPFPKLDSAKSPTLRQTSDSLRIAMQEVLQQPAKLLANRWKSKFSKHLMTSRNVLVESTLTEANATTHLYVAVIELANPDATNEAESTEDSHFFMIRKATGPEDADYEVCRVTLDSPSFEDLRIQDLKFVDDTELLLLLHSTRSDKADRLVAIDYSSLNFHSGAEITGAICSATIPCTRVSTTKDRGLPIAVRPVSLSVNGAQGRRTGMYLQADRQRYTVFDLDNEGEDVEEEDESEESDDFAEEMEED